MVLAKTTHSIDPECRTQLTYSVHGSECKFSKGCQQFPCVCITYSTFTIFNSKHVASLVLTSYSTAEDSTVSMLIVHLTLYQKGWGVCDCHVSVLYNGHAHCYIHRNQTNSDGCLPQNHPRIHLPRNKQNILCNTNSTSWYTWCTAVLCHVMF